ncbi:MAG: hypothetical protein WCK35_17480 [Chloroflexota bacterium]
MNTKPNTPETENVPPQPTWLAQLNRPEIYLALVVLLIGLGILFTPLGKWMFAVDSQQFWWFITRSAGIVAYLLLWLSVVWGLAVPSKLVAPVLEGVYTFDFHQFISLLSIAFVLLHILVLTLDRYLPYSLFQILIPFISPYRPEWVGLGVISFYIMLIVAGTFYIRARIGMNTFRQIHYFSLAAYLGVTLHGLFSGTDSPLVSMQFIYLGSSFVVIVLTVYWLNQKSKQNQLAKQKALAAARAKNRR